MNIIQKFINVSNRWRLETLQCWSVCFPLSCIQHLYTIPYCNVEMETMGSLLESDHLQKYGVPVASSSWHVICRPDQTIIVRKPSHRQQLCMPPILQASGPASCKVVPATSMIQADTYVRNEP